MDKDTINVNAQDSLTLSSTSFTRSSFYIARDSGVVGIFEDGGRGRKGGGLVFVEKYFSQIENHLFPKSCLEGGGGCWVGNPPILSTIN